MTVVSFVVVRVPRISARTVVQEFRAKGSFHVLCACNLLRNVKLRHYEHVHLLHVYDLHEGTWSLYNVAQRTTTIALDREDRRGHIKL